MLQIVACDWFVMPEMKFSFLGHQLCFPSDAKCDINVGSGWRVPSCPPCYNFLSHQQQKPGSPVYQVTHTAWLVTFSLSLHLLGPVLKPRFLTPMGTNKLLACYCGFFWRPKGWQNKAPCGSLRSCGGGHCVDLCPWGLVEEIRSLVHQPAPASSLIVPSWEVTLWMMTATSLLSTVCFCIDHSCKSAASCSFVCFSLLQASSLLFFAIFLVSFHFSLSFSYRKHFLD